MDNEGEADFLIIFSSELEYVLHWEAVATRELALENWEEIVQAKADVQSYHFFSTLARKNSKRAIFYLLEKHKINKNHKNMQKLLFFLAYVRKCGLRPRIERHGCNFEDTDIARSNPTSKLRSLNAAYVQYFRLKK